MDKSAFVQRVKETAAKSKSFCRGKFLFGLRAGKGLKQTEVYVYRLYVFTCRSASKLMEKFRHSCESFRLLLMLFTFPLIVSNRDLCVRKLRRKIYYKLFVHERGVKGM